MNSKPEKERKIRNISIIQGDDGKILPEYKPAIYLDSSFVIYYWLVEDLDLDKDELKLTEISYYPLMRKLFKSEEKFEKIFNIREKILSGKNIMTPVVSPLATLELMEWYTESGFRNIAFGAAGYNIIKNMGKKDIGEYVKKLLELRKEEIDKDKLSSKNNITELGMLHSELWLNRSYAICNGLQGLSEVGIQKFNFSIDETWKLPSLLSFLQIGLADIMHIILAKHLGCEFICSLDSDFTRVKDFVKEELDITILCNLDEILRII